MEEQTNKIAAFCSGLLALINVALHLFTKCQVSPESGILAVFRGTNSKIDTANDRSDTANNCSNKDRQTFFQHRSLDTLCCTQIPVVIACIVIANYDDLRSYGAALAIYQTLFVQSLHLIKRWELGRRRVWHVAAGCAVVLGMLIASACMKRTLAGRVLLLLIVPVIEVWSAIECAWTLYGLSGWMLWIERNLDPEDLDQLRKQGRFLLFRLWGWKLCALRGSEAKKNLEAILLFTSILFLSSSSPVGCLVAALRVDTSDGEILYAIAFFACVPVQLVWSGHAGWKCCVRWKRARRSSHPDVEVPDHSPEDRRDRPHLGPYSGSSFDAPMDGRSSDRGLLTRESSVHPEGFGARPKTAE